MEYARNNYLNVIPGYLENLVSKSRHFYHTGFEDSLESIVLKEEPDTETGMFEKVFSDKKKNLRATVKALFNEIMLRERLDLFLLYKIDADMFRHNSYIDQIKRVAEHSYSFALFRDLSSTRLKLEGNVLDLEKEKRKEYLECWRDLSFLKKYLLSALKDYWDLSRRSEALTYDFSGSGENENRERH
jgi:hypothetical protein